MAKLCFMFLVALLAAHQIAARVLPGDAAAGYTDQKNFATFGGLGGYSGIGGSGLPFGGIGGGLGAGIGGGIGTLPTGGLGGLGGGIGGLGVGAGGGVGIGAGGGGAGTGALPYP